MATVRTPFGVISEGSAVECYTLSNDSGMEARVMTYGGTLLSLRVPDREGNSADVVLGFDTLAPYLEEHPYFGALIGRYANRIARGHFRLHRHAYQLACNDGRNHLHGGVEGFDRKIWHAHVPVSAAGAQLTLRCHSPDGDEGYPGNLQVEASYTLSPDNALRIDYRAVTDAPTIVNLTSHAYFNLAAGGDVLGHEVRILAERYLPVDRQLIPTGEVAAVAGTPMDFRRLRRIDADMPSSDAQLQFAAGGYDHCWALDDRTGGCSLAAEVREAGSGRRLRVYTTQPGLQFYTGNFLDATLAGKDGVRYDRHAGFCLETQHVPHAPNRAAFPSTVLLPHESYRQTTIYQFDSDG